MKKGFIFSFDSFLALVMFTLFTILIYFFFIFSTPTTQQYFFSEDLLNVLSTVKISEIQATYPSINQMVLDGKIKNTDLTIIEQVLTFQIENNPSDACGLFSNITNNLLPPNYKTVVDVTQAEDDICGQQISNVINLISRNRIAIGRRQA